jgi:hypothetical protein
MSNFAQNGERVENADGLRIFFRSGRAIVGGGAIAFADPLDFRGDLSDSR